MDSLIAHQHILFGRIARTVDNLRKQGKANINKGTILAKLSCLDQAWAQFQDRDAQIIASTTEENRQVDYFTEDFFDQTQDVYCNQKGILSTMLEDVEQSQAPSTAGHPPTPGPRPRSSLPRITLPTFSGQFTDWTRFRDLFMSLVIDDEAWTDAERFHYLSASLTGEAAQLIQRIPVTAANFDQAWKLLEHRYQNRRLLVAAQFDALYNIKPCVNHSATELKGLLNSTCNATAVLNSLGVPVTDESHWIVHHTIRRLDRHTLKEWEKSLGNSVNLPAFSELLEFLETTTRTLEAFEFRQGTRTPAPSKPPPTKVKALHTATDAASRPRCNLCQGDHILCFCSAFRSLTPAARLQMVTSRRWCKNCLGPHTVGNCPSAKRCQRCAQPHHTMLHEASDGSSNASTVATLHTTKRLNSTSDSGPVLLATALVTATAGRRMVTARALIDPCSEVSLISEALAQTMRLPRTSCSRLVLGAGGKATATSRGKVRLTLTSTVPGLGRSCTVEALVLPRLTAYKPSGATHTPRWPHINGLPLADPRGYVAVDNTLQSLKKPSSGGFFQGRLREEDHPPESSPLPTLSKRYVLSQVAKLFDPLGWLAPATIRGKIFLQQLWQHRLDWDEQLPSTAAETWRKLSADAANLTSLRLPRWLGTEPATTTQQLHVFVDASERAYAAAAYIRTSNPHRTQVTLVAAKTKTAPLQSLSLPRLELCAAVLGARLLSHLRREMGLQFDTSHLWSDSTVTLAWLHGEPTRWRTFVANRVAEFHRTVPDVRLHHVGSQDNPADCASRGIPASQLASHPLWWHGPAWLTEHPTTWDTTSPTLDTTEEERAPTTTSFHTRIADTEHESLLHRYSSLTRLLRVTAWCLRWTRRRPAPSPGDVFPILHPEEVSQAEALWIKIVQGSTFERELSALNNGQPLRPSSALRATTPFLDNQGILRVGGRLKNSLLSYDEQHPIILPSGSKLTEMIVEQHHRRTLHGGVQLTLASVRQRFWIPQGRQNVKKCVSRCIRCLRWRAATASQLMGDLPLHRVTPSRPFTHTGVDYAGPFKLKTAPGRGHKSIKGYVAIFVCYSSRAVHLEAVSDYTTAAFLAAFRRFTGRRGPCASVTSDCGTNFVGADQELRRMFRASSKEAAAIAGQLSKEGVRWKFIPPGAPHFGGLWEAAVRSVKHHLRRVVGDNAHTYEELATFLCQVEACLNSRPLQALTDDPEDLTPLTPGHFLVGGPLLATPEPTLHDVPTSRLSRWQQLQQRVEHFWRRWSAEYLHQIQTRRKWTTTQPSLGVGDLVLVKSEATPPTKWPLARITDVHPGADGHVRVITVRTATTSLTRPVTKIVRLLQTGENQA
ncbi:uncharacterized protein LOC143363739 [Halictus rubicundus]|uniref:uncharacterized protein LOC143363739 n=1 Tax=Halictus rubicundus TaxID=77578 RepID=UPI004035B4DD